MNNIDTWKQQLRNVARLEKVKILSSFFKTGKGEYGEGDIFIGIPVPDNRSVSRHYHSMPLYQIKAMLLDPIHEFRLAGLLALVEAYKRAKGNQERCREIVEFYLANTASCNNWVPSFGYHQLRNFGYCRNGYCNGNCRKRTLCA